MSRSYFEEVTARCAKQAREAIAGGEVITQLPLWDDDQRGAPAAVLRSALFGIIKRGRRAAVEKHLLASWSGSEIRYTGFRLDQADFDCWLEVMHLARQFPLGRDVRFTARGFLRAIGRKGAGGKDLQWLDSSLTRMVACAVTIRLANGQEYTGPLISEFFFDRDSGRYVVRINPLIAQLFDEAFVKLSVATRQRLSTDFARWLQGYVQSHRATEAQPHRVGLVQLQALCGSDTTRLRRFRESIRAAMNELQQQEVILRWRITEGNALEFARPWRT